jgi:Ni,Fe-hydrogenase maturation factor
VIADTATGIAPGEVVTLTFEQVLANPGGPTPRSSHALPIELVIGVANALNGAPLDGLFVGIGGSDFGFGTVPSLEVRRALPKFTTAIKAALRRLAPVPAAVGV